MMFQLTLKGKESAFEVVYWEQLSRKEPLKIFTALSKYC